MSDFQAVGEALAQRVDNLIRTDGAITFPAVPALVDMYADRCVAVFAAAGRMFTEAERTHLRSALAEVVADAYVFSQRSTVTVNFRSQSAGPMNYLVVPNFITLAQSYDEWIANREPPLFGTEPDARVMALSQESQTPSAAKVLDIGAGTGRNALALARRGHPVDAAEVNEAFAETIALAAQQESLPVRTIRRDVFGDEVFLRSDYALIVISGVVSEFRTTDQLRGLFELAARCLSEGGSLVANVFVALNGYTPDDAARQFAQLSYSGFFTRQELADAVADMPLELVADDSVHDYERAHLPEGTWPPTGWYVNWVTGRDVFGPKLESPPIELRWLVYRKTDHPKPLRSEHRPSRWSISDPVAFGGSVDDPAPGRHRR